MRHSRMQGTVGRVLRQVRRALALSPLLFGLPVSAQAHLDLPGRSGPAWLLCDSLSTPETLVVGTPGQSGRAVITVLPHGSNTYTWSTWVVGPPTAGAGSVYYPLRATAGPAQPQDALRLLNPGVTVNPAFYAFAPLLVSVTLHGGTRTCRLVPGVRVLGVTERRTVLVTQDRAGALTYQAFDFARSSAVRGVPGDSAARTSTPSVSVPGGHAVTTGTGVVFSFTNRGTEYEVRVEGGRGSVTVRDAGSVRQRETLRAFITGGPGQVR